MTRLKKLLMEMWQGSFVIRCRETLQAVKEFFRWDAAGEHILRSFVRRTNDDEQEKICLNREFHPAVLRMQRRRGAGGLFSVL